MPMRTGGGDGGGDGRGGQGGGDRPTAEVQKVGASVRASVAVVRVAAVSAVVVVSRAGAVAATTS